VFQKHLAEQPLRQAVLADIALHVKLRCALVLRPVPYRFDRAP